MVMVSKDSRTESLTQYGPGGGGGGGDLDPPVRFFSVAPEVVMEGL